MMSTLRGGGGYPHADIVREVAWIYYYESGPNADKGGGGSKYQKSVGGHCSMVSKVTDLFIY